MIEVDSIARIFQIPPHLLGPPKTVRQRVDVAVAYAEAFGVDALSLDLEPAVSSLVLADRLRQMGAR